MSYTNLIYKSICFIEENLQQPIKVKDIADHIQCSLFHFIRIFNQVVQHSPYDYLMRRRLSDSVSALRNPKKRIIEIAFDYQFNSHEAFSRAFKKMFQVSPNQFRNPKCLEPEALLPRLSPEYLSFIEAFKGYLIPEMIDLEQKVICGYICSSDESDEIKTAYYELINKGQIENDNDIYGIHFCNSIAKNRRPYFLIGPAVNLQKETICTNKTFRIIPGGNYAVFEIDDEIFDYQHFQAFLRHTWSPSSGKKILNCEITEKYIYQSGRENLIIQSLLVPLVSG